MKMESIKVGAKTIYLSKSVFMGQPTYAVRTSKRYDFRKNSGRWTVGYVRKNPAGDYAWRLARGKKWRTGGTRKEAVIDLLLEVGINKQRARTRKKNDACLCRKPTRHPDCMYCGSGYWGEKVCGVCKEQGIDGRVIRGTERRVCRKHKGTSKTKENQS